MYCIINDSTSVIHEFDIFQFTWTFGSMFEVTMAYYLLPNWRYLVAGSAIPLCVAIFFLYFVSFKV